MNKSQEKWNIITVDTYKRLDLESKPFDEIV